MAADNDVANEILRAFVGARRTEMTLVDLQDTVTTRVSRVSADEVQQILRSPSLSNLFVLPLITSRQCLVKLSPKLTLCEACLTKGCKYKTNCTKIHMCRFLSHLPGAPRMESCRYPHKLSDHPNNIFLLQKYRCNTLDEDLLLKLLRLEYRTNAEQSGQQQEIESERSVRPPQGNSRGPRPRTNLPQSKTPAPLNNLPTTSWSTKPTTPPVRPPLPTLDNEMERQLDVSIPSEDDAPNLDLEIVELLITTRDIKIEQILNKQISTPFYRRFTLQFESKQVIDDLLKTEPIIEYNNVSIKLKRTVRKKDTRLFTINIHTNKTIDTMRLSLYVETLIGKVNPNIVNLTPDGNDEQIYLIRCEEPIDFVRLHKAHASKNSLQNRRVTIGEIYEAETLEVSYVQGSSHAPITIPRLQQLFGANCWQQEVFACLNIYNNDSADIEMMDAEVTARWLARASQIERDLSVTIRPIIDFVKSSQENTEEDEEVTKFLAEPQESSPSLSPSAAGSSVASDEAQKIERDPNLYILKPDWRIVLTHPKFGQEYRDYIRQHLNISIQVIGSMIHVPDEYIRKELARYTNMFIQTFVFRELVQPSKIDVGIIKKNYTRMAHKWQTNTNKTVIAARREIMHELFPHLCTQPPRKGMTPTVHHKQSPIQRQPFASSLPIVPQHDSQLLLPPGESREKISLPSSSIRNVEDVQKTLQYPIENAVYFPFFASPSSFADRLGAYLESTFNVQLEVKPVASTKIVLELKGRPEDVSSARPALTTLFASLKTKTYSDETNACKFAIPDAYRVVQYNLDQRSMTCSCTFAAKNEGSLCVRYFADNPQFGIDEQQLDDVILNTLVAMSSPISRTSKRFKIKLHECLNNIQQRSDYGQQICCSYDNQTTSTNNQLSVVHLFGEPSTVKQLHSQVNDIIKQYEPEWCNVNLRPNEIEFLLQIASIELARMEKKYEDDGVDLRSKLKDRNSQFLAPNNLHEKIKLFLLETAKVQEISKEFNCSEELISNKKRELNDLAVRHDCVLSIKSSPQAAASDVAAASSNQLNRSSPMFLPVGSGCITICNGDITTQKSDVLVVCSSSQGLREGFKTAAGMQVVQELKGKDLTKSMVETSVGQLQQAKKLLFVPWTPSLYLDTLDPRALQQSVSTFVEQAIKYTINEKFKSIAFPAIGCGGYNVPPDTIATYMLDAARAQLISQPTVQLDVNFVVQQQPVFDIFCSKLKPGGSLVSASSRFVSASIPSRSSTGNRVTITLISSSNNSDGPTKCLTKIETILNSFS